MSGEAAKNLPEEIQFFSDYIEKELGIVYDERNAFQLENRLNEIKKILDLTTIKEVYEKAKGGGLHGHFKQLVLDIATNNETQFFRDKNVFKYIESKVLPELFSKNNNLVRIWSMASSYGQEPYSLAMLIDQYQGNKPRVEILATDISDRVLEKAGQGKFSQLEIQRGLPIQLLTKYFTKGEDSYWFIKEDIRKIISFKKMNLLELSAVSGSFDLILCRNVLIYQNSERKMKILQNITNYLNKDSYLFLGASESLIGMDVNLKQTVEDQVVHYKLKE